MSKTINDIIKDGILRLTIHHKVVWHHDNGAFITTVRDIKFHLSDKRGTCECCCEESADCSCEDEPTEAGVQLTVEFNSPGLDGREYINSYDAPALNQLADVAKILATNPLPAYNYHDGADALSSLLTVRYS